MTGESLYCQNCRRDIAAANYVIHSAHCERKIQLCTICNEPVPRTEIEQHLEDSHSYAACELCGVGVEKWLMDKHKNTCFKRPVSCEFCELDFPFDELDEHKDICGARTEKCSICKAFVKLKDQHEHQKACQREWEANLNSVKCESCRKSIPTNMFHQHVSVCGSQSEKCPKCGEMVLTKEKYMHICKGRIIDCEYCNVSMPTDVFSQHISMCGSQIKNCPKCNASFMQKDRKTHQCQSVNKSFGSCSICQQNVSWIDLREHESACRLVTFSGSDEDEEEKPKFSAIPMHQKKQGNYRQMDVRSQKRTQETPNIRKMNQCLYCKERFPDLILKDHLEECSERPSKCELCFQTILLKDKLNHEKRDCKMIHGNKNSHSTFPPGYTKIYEMKMNQCPYCKERYPDLTIADHLQECLERPSKCELCLEIILLKDKLTHETQDCKMIHGNENSYSTVPPGYTNKSHEMKLKQCSYCNKKFPEIMFQDHLIECEECPYQCRLCLKMMPVKNKINHDIRECNGDKVRRDYTGGKKNKKKNKNKGVQHEPVEQKSGWLSSLFTNKKPSSPVKEFPTRTYFQPQMALLPCEFCDELFPESLIIEHQSGCRPDLVSYHKQEKSSHSDERRASPEKDPRNYRDAKSTGALPKRNRYNQNDHEVGQGPFFYHQNPPKEPTKERDYYHYPSGVPDYSMQSNVGVVKPTGKKLSPEREVTLDNKSSYESEEKKGFTKNSEAQIFNFSSSSKKSTSNQPKSQISIYSSPPRKVYSNEQNTEIKAVGAERAERKGIIRISRDTPMNLGDLSDEAPDKYDTNYQVSKSSQNSENKYERKDLYSPKLQYSQERYNIPCSDETSHIVESEKVKSSCATRLLEQQLNNSNVGTNNPEPCDDTEDDAKNEETFGNNFNPRKNRSLSNESDNMSDSGEHFYDAEENLKVLNVENEDGSTFMDQNLDVYLQYLMKNESIAPNDNRNEVSPYPPMEKTLNCQCENEICYCDIINRTNGTENNNNFQAEVEGHLHQENIPAESLNLKACSDENGANNFQCEETSVLGGTNHVNNAEVKKPSPKWDKWRSQNIYPSDSE